jgi:hypothetical protein
MNEAVLGEDAGFVERNVALRFAELNLIIVLKLNFSPSQPHLFGPGKIF